MTQEQKQKILTMMQAMQHTDWVNLGKFTKEEQEYIIFCIQNQRGCSFETNGVSYRPETHSKFRRLDVDVDKYLNKIK